ncbi:Cercosporin toxin biosynthesis cluster 6 [Hyphodiscus hymeniophilus]|uniref:Cercosporin toxin biosynthesis cluster 6 n=1 Tax=Hyphodiscus hymeniophilus TaxID=353542 RepID=A0A9P6VFE8_9HELO|nr:Cercosporin toxin biosynthesis cluster 6 [Hyphodiscus hymeniophilus]
MAPKSVLVTGANGHLGFRALVSALETGYKVRAVIRRQAAADQIKAAKSTQPYSNQIEIVFVQDLLREGAFDEAVVGMDYVLHIASPVSRPSEDYYADFIEPAVQGTLGLLRSVAKRSPSVKRVVITSSIAALNISLPSVSETDLAPVPDPHAFFANSFAGYAASKQIALSQTSRSLADNKATFDVIHILPAVILGKNELATSVTDFSSGTNRYAMNIALGIDAPAPMIGATVHVDDVGLLHVLALDEKVKVGETGVRNFIASAASVTWSEVSEIARVAFPGEVEKGVLKLGGKMDTKTVKLDTRATDREFNISWKGLEEQVKSVLGHYLEIKAKD